MTETFHTIGELSRLSGVSVRRIRFYSDRGLLPPRERTAANYRIYADADIARLDLIRALRASGLGLAAIRRVLARPVSLGEVLSLRLKALEADIAAKRRLAAVLRATLRNPSPSEADLRRLWTMTSLTNAQSCAMVERLFDAVTAGMTIDEAWKRQMIEAGTPELPDAPTPEQIDAWNEIAAMLGDAQFIATMRAEMAGMWAADFDAEAYARGADAILARTRAAIASGERPDGDIARSIARDWLDASAKAMRRAPDAAFLAWHLDQYRKHHTRSLRYQKLQAILRGEDPRHVEDPWLWINEAMETQLG